MTDLKTGTRVRYNSSAGNGGVLRFSGLSGTVRTFLYGRRGVCVLWDNGVESYHTQEYLIPLEVVDALPPAPESVMYFNSNASVGNDQRLTVRNELDHTGADSLLIAVKIRAGSNYNTILGVKQSGIGVNLDADAALQLASDLTRMAMEMKRKGK